MKCGGYEKHGDAGYCKYAYDKEDDVLPQVDCGGNFGYCDLSPPITSSIQKWVKEPRITEIYIRPEILAFAEEMEKKMSEHDPGKGDSWKKMHFNYMDKKLLEEVAEYYLTKWSDIRFIRELIYAIQKVTSPKIADIQSELTDIGVMSAMLWNIREELYRKKEEEDVKNK